MPWMSKIQQEMELFWVRKSISTRWFNSWPFDPLVRAHQQPLKGSRFHHPKTDTSRNARNALFVPLLSLFCLSTPWPTYTMAYQPKTWRYLDKSHVVLQRKFRSIWSSKSNRCDNGWLDVENSEPPGKKNYFTSSDPHHDMLGGGCQVRVVIENMMGRMENLRRLISGFLGLVILVRWVLVTMFLSWTTQTGCRIHRTYVSLIGSGEGRHTTHLLKCVLLLSTSQTDWKQSSDVLSDISFDILSDISSDISSDILSDISFEHAFWHIFWHSFWHIKTKT